MKLSLLIWVSLGALIVALVGAADAVAQEPAAAKPPANPHAVPNPVLIKVPFTFSGMRMENTPVVFQGRPMLVQNFRSGEVKAAGFYLFVEDLTTGQELARFGETFSFVSAFVDGEQLNVFATENTDDDWTHDIYRFTTTDLKTWNKELAIKRREGEHLFNASVCKDDQGYVMAFESNLPVQWCFRFARSKDLSKWDEVEGVQFADLAEKTACGNPCIRYFAPYYYMIYGAWRWQGPGTWYEYALEETKYITLIARSKDLAAWELSPTKYTMLDVTPGEGINNTDADLFEFEGNTYVYYATGNQQEWANIRVAMHPGPMKEFLESYFPDGIPMITFDAKAGRYIYPDKQSVHVGGFHGEVTGLRELPPCGLSDASAKPDMDLVAMSRWALRALQRNPRPNLEYECRFSMNLLNYPPGPGPDDHDPITAGDTENRLDWAFGYMKDMCGETSADPVALGVRKRIMGHLRDDGLCWAPTSAFSRLPGIWANHWTTGKLLISLSNDYTRTKDESLRPLCRTMFEALRNRADWVDGRAYYAGGNSCWNNESWAITDASPYNPAMPLEAIVTYYEAFKDEEALAFAKAFAAGEMANDQWEHWILRDPSKLTAEQQEQVKLTSSIEVWPTAPVSSNLGVRPDGSFDHHSHMRGHSGWGMCHLAAVTKDPELVAWCKRLLDFYLARGTDYGWIPESMTYPRRSETCAVADVIDMAACLAQCGYPEYWDVVERFVRNYIREAQFFLTDEYVQLYKQLHPGEEGELGLERAREFEGGFQGAMGLADRCYAGHEMDMMGCCVPEGMRAIHTAWINAIRKEASGVYVNMSFNRDAPEATATSFLPDLGRLTVHVKTNDDFYLRTPAWAARDQVNAYRNDTPVDVVWRDGYVFFENAASGDALTVTYPLISFVQKLAVKNAPGEPDRELTVTWLGNTVTKLEPKGEQLPLYQQAPRVLPPLPE